MKKETLLQKIRSIKMSLIVHPDNQDNSEFADRISDLEEIEHVLVNSRVVIEPFELEKRPNLYYPPEED